MESCSEMVNICEAKPTDRIFKIYKPLMEACRKTCRFCDTNEACASFAEFCHKPGIKKTCPGTCRGLASMAWDKQENWKEMLYVLKSFVNNKRLNIVNKCLLHVRLKLSDWSSRAHVCWSIWYLCESRYFYLLFPKNDHSTQKEKRIPLKILVPSERLREKLSRTFLCSERGNTWQRNLLAGKFYTVL
jgi:hypothetical protein